jgi:lipopolysaccharide biosynthesis regulator YciM
MGSPKNKNETLANMMRRMSTNSPVKKTTAKKTQEQKKRVEALAKLMQNDKTYLVYVSGSYPKGYKKSNKIDAIEKRMAEKLYIRRRKAAEKKEALKKAAEKEKREKERKAEIERREREKKAENLAMNTYARNLFDNLNKARDQNSIRKAYKKGVLRIHPNKGGDAELFKKFQAKYNLKKR